MSRIDRQEKHLEKLAQGNVRRESVVAGRRSRFKSVNRQVVCLLCLETTYTYRGKEDPCGQCVEDLWSAQDVSHRAAESALGTGMVAVKFSKRSHDFPYPHFQSGHAQVPADAAFAQATGYRDGEMESSPARTFQMLIHKILVGLAEAFPLPPDYKNEMMPLLGTMYDNDHRALLPKKTVAGIMELWPFVQWLATYTFEEGLTEGRSLLSQLNNGTLTMDHFSDQIAKQTEHIHRAREKAEKGDKR